MTVDSICDLLAIRQLGNSATRREIKQRLSFFGQTVIIISSHVFASNNSLPLALSEPATASHLQKLEPKKKIVPNFKKKQWIVNKKNPQSCSLTDIVCYWSIVPSQSVPGPLSSVGSFRTVFPKLGVNYPQGGQMTRGQKRPKLEKKNVIWMKNAAK